MVGYKFISLMLLWLRTEINKHHLYVFSITLTRDYSDYEYDVLCGLDYYILTESEKEDRVVAEQ